jgi:hypothetical protein
MNNSMRRLTQATIGIAALALTMTATTPTFARGERALKVQAVSVAGHTIAVTIANAATRSSRALVTARVLTTRGFVTVRATITASAGDSTTVRMDLPDTTAVDVPPLGVVVDDGVPF